MPKHAIDYSKTVIYKIACKDVSIPDEYVGSTTRLVNRKHSHKSDCGNENGKYFHFTVYVFIRDHGGWDNWELIVIEAFPCKTSEEQRTRERFWKETLGATLNMVNPIQTREDDAITQRKLYLANREARIEYRKVHYAANIEAIHKKQKIHYDANRDTLNERERERVQCECGADVCRGALTRHKKTAKHIEAMAAK